jgi:hypothetical protein
MNLVVASSRRNLCQRCLNSATAIVSKVSGNLARTVAWRRQGLGGIITADKPGSVADKAEAPLI